MLKADLTFILITLSKSCSFILISKLSLVIPALFIRTSIVSKSFKKHSTNFSHSSKSENKIGYFKTELIKPISPLYFNDKERTSALISICSLLNILLPESQPNKKIYNSFEKLIGSINLENWIFMYIFFELNLIKDLGYDTNLGQYSSTEIKNNDILKTRFSINDLKIMPGQIAEEYGIIFDSNSDKFFTGIMSQNDIDRIIYDAPYYTCIN